MRPTFGTLTGDVVLYGRVRACRRYGDARCRIAFMPPESFGARLALGAR